MKKILFAIVIISALMLSGCEIGAGKATQTCPTALYSPANNPTQFANSVSDCYNRCNVQGCILEKIEYMDSWKGKGPTIKCTCRALPTATGQLRVTGPTDTTYGQGSTETLRQPTPGQPGTAPSSSYAPGPVPTPTPRPSGGTPSYPQQSPTPQQSNPYGLERNTLPNTYPSSAGYK